MATAWIWTWEAKLRSSRSKALIAAVVIPGFLAGCADSLNHRDTITLGLGDAVETNAAIHTIDPFPKNAENTRIMTHGSILRRPKILIPAANAPASGDVSVGAGAPSLSQ
jgi:hypothetical protein